MTTNLRFGIFIVLFGAFLYTLSNMALRMVAAEGGVGWAIWVCAHKAFASVVIAWALILHGFWKKKNLLPTGTLMWKLIAAGCLFHLGGNVGFQLGLKGCGLAISVAVTFAAILSSGALFSRLILHEPLTMKTFSALIVLMIAIGFLTFGGDTNSAVDPENSTLTTLLLGILASAVCGTSFGYIGIVIRQSVSGLSLASSLVWLATPGVVVFGGIALAILGPSVITQTTAEQFAYMQLAGIFNAAAFFCVAESFRHLTVNQSNLINASQIAMAGTAGILLFGEPFSWSYFLGAVLTVCGLLMMDRRQVKLKAGTLVDTETNPPANPHESSPQPVAESSVQ